MKFDYSQAFKLSENPPNLAVTFQKLASIRTPLRRNGEIFVFFFFLFTGSLVTMNIFNVEYRNNSLDYSNGFKVLPDYLSQSRLVAFRKERKQFLLY